MPKVRPLHFPVFLTGVLLTIAFAVYAARPRAPNP